jgi:hypothetical protein
MALSSGERETAAASQIGSREGHEREVMRLVMEGEDAKKFFDHERHIMRAIIDGINRDIKARWK